MIIRTSPRRSYTALPNAIFRDKRLSIDTKGLLAYLLSLPPNWEIKPPIVAKTLSATGCRPIGRERLKRMFGELQAACYMAKSKEQSHRDGGYWGPFTYIVGAEPAAVVDEAASHGVAFQPQSALPSAAQPSAAQPSAAKPQAYKRTIDLRKNRKRQTPSGPPSSTSVEEQQAAYREDGSEPFSAFANAYPFEPWMSRTAAASLWDRLDSFDRVHAVVGAELYAHDCKLKQRKVQNAKTWLRERAWEGYYNLRNADGSTTVAPYSDEWRAERERLLAAGESESVAFMDERAAAHQGWSVQR
jgi:hypothetical protein